MMEEALKSKIAAFTHPLVPANIREDLKDLEPLREALRGARIVALGEGSHGTREHFLMKNRIIRFLVEEMGFHTFVIEASQWQCYNINDYVIMGKGDKYEALASQKFWTWDTQEVMEMIDWMRDYNLHCQRGQECRFLGFDMQIISDICPYLKALKPLMETQTAEKLVRFLEDVLAAKRGQPAPDLESTANWLSGWVQQNMQALKNRFGQRQTELFIEAAATLQQYILMTVQKDGNEMRDLCMAENVARMVDGVDFSEKFILWAHNGHIAHHFEWKNMGELLKERYGSLYYAMGLALGRGSFQSRLFNRETKAVGALQAFEIPEFPEYVWEKDLSAVRPEDYFLDLHKAADDEQVSAWMSQEKPFVMLDEAWDPEHGLKEYEYPMVLSKSYDGIIFTHHTSHAISNPSGKRG
ncbi:MAG: erythromycin esterase family protein [Anaerolineaceae bacterium]|nr:erythromycin esterase family protein [Anaerolineaceae bacterium]